jgi:hypothetical protein
MNVLKIILILVLDYQLFFAECEAVHLVVAGDFNTHFGYSTFESFTRFFLMTIIFVGLIITDRQMHVLILMMLVASVHGLIMF